MADDPKPAAAQPKPLDVQVTELHTAIKALSDKLDTLTTARVPTFECSCGPCNECSTCTPCSSCGICRSCFTCRVCNVCRTCICAECGGCGPCVAQ